MSESTRFSFEFFPPGNAAQSRQFWRSFGMLEVARPAFASMTWGALGSDSRASLDVLRPLANETDVPLMAHLSCVGQTADQLATTLDTLANLGVRKILALRGDAPAGDSGIASTRRLRHASDLVSLITDNFPQFDVSVAAYPEVHPESESSTMDLYWLKFKLDCGARRAFTQFFFDADDFLRFRDRAAAIGIDKPLIPGILPIHDIDAVTRFATKCGATVPASLVDRFARAGDATSQRSVAVEVCVDLCRRLSDEGVNDFHLYTLNRAELSRAVVRAVQGNTVEIAA